MKSVLIADDEVDRARWWHFTTLLPASRQMSELSTDSGGLDGLPFGGSYVGVLVLISTVWAQQTKRALTRALIGGAQPVEGWWAPVAQHTYKRKSWGSVEVAKKRSPPIAPPMVTLADRGCAEATGSATGPPSLHRSFVVRRPCPTPPPPSSTTSTAAL